MGKEIMFEIGLSNLLIIFFVCSMSFIMSLVINVYFLIIESKYINAFQKIAQEPEKGLAIAKKMLPRKK